MNSRSVKSVFLYLLFIFLSLTFRLINIQTPIGNDMYAFRQTQTAITIQNYLNEGYSFFNYQTPLFGSPWTVPFEAPIYQSLVFFTMKLLNRENIDLWGRLVSILLFYLSALMLYLTTVKIYNKRAAIFVFFIYLFSPFNIYWSRAVLIDFTAVFFSLAYTYFFYRYLQTPRKSTFFLGIFSGTFAYLTKSTTMFAYVFFLAFIALRFLITHIQSEYNAISLQSVKKYTVNNIKFLFCVFLLCIIPVITGALWNRWADLLKSRNIATLFLTSQNLKQWNFGTSQQRTSFKIWSGLFRNLFESGYGLIIIIPMGIFLFSSLKRKSNIFFLFRICIISILLTAYILVNLFYVHKYYFIAVSPLVCMAQGFVIEELTQRVKLPNILEKRIITSVI